MENGTYQKTFKAVSSVKKIVAIALSQEMNCDHMNGCNFETNENWQGWLDKRQAYRIEGW